MQRFSNSTKKTKPSLVTIFLIIAIDIYRFLLGPSIRSMFGISNECRYSISCSQYAKQVIMSQGTARGSFLAVKRIISCK